MTALILLSDWQKSQIEFWKPIEGYDGYDVSSFGRVRTCWVSRGAKRRKGEWRILKQTLNKKNYLVVTFNRTCRVRQHRVNRVVALAFLSNPLRLPITNHKNGVKSDNRTDNIEWATDLDNQTHAWKAGLKDGMLYKMRHFSAATISEFRWRHANGERVAALAREYGMDKGLAHRIARRQSYAKDIDPTIPTERLSLHVR